MFRLRYKLDEKKYFEKLTEKNMGKHTLYM